MILVFIEQRDGKIRKASLEALSGARAEARRRPAAAAICRQGGGRAGATSASTAPTVSTSPTRGSSPSTPTRGTSRAVTPRRRQEKPEAVLIPATAMGKDLAPRYAARLDAGLVSDASS